MDVRLVGYTEVRAQEYVFKNWPAERINLQRAGIHLIVYQKGKLGRFDLGALVLVFITGGGLMTAARMFIELWSRGGETSPSAHRRRRFSALRLIFTSHAYQMCITVPVFMILLVIISILWATWVQRSLQLQFVFYIISTQFNSCTQYII